MTRIERLLAILFLCTAVFLVGYSVGTYRMLRTQKVCPTEPKKLSLDMPRAAERNWINYYRRNRI